ncbi:MAG TPA: DinB family protein [Longimicrobiales bacterium]|nr:DinB family protein [Longimicrobiales bacterium]
MNDAQINNPWLAQRARELQTSIVEIERDVAPLAYLQIGWRPPDGGWSIAQVMEHLIITDQSYIDALEPLLAQPPRRVVQEAWRPSLMGGLLTRSQMPDSKRKLTTPRIWRPAPEARAHVVEEYIAVRKRLLQLLERADGHDLRRTRLSSPAARWIRMNLGDAFMTLIVHTQRHLQQIRRIKEFPDFPRQ